MACHRKNRKARRPAMRRMAVLVSLPVLLAANVLCSSAWGQPANALPSSPTTTYGTAIQTAYGADGKSLTITQSAPTNIVTWNSFNIGSAASVNIVQPSTTATLLNKVSGTSLSPTTIEGMLNANGRVYIYDPNGIIFGKTATVNVNTLIASSLKFDESRVIGGLVLPGSTPVLGADPNYVGTPGNVVVEGDSGGAASITTSNGGLILLAAPGVTNNGILSAPNGQVMLAAGSNVYLAAPSTGQTSLRGLLVEVSNPTSQAVPLTASGDASAAVNGTTGQISVGQGNATMIGYAVNQNGLVSATTSVNLNGSIYLYARDQAVLPDANGAWKASRTGALTLGPGSVTEVQPLADDPSTITAATAFNKSDVELNGATIQLQQNAAILAPGGNVNINAQEYPPASPLYGTTVLDPTLASASRVDLAAGSIIDVSGMTSAVLPMSSNVITVNLRGTEFADNTLLNNSSSPLYGANIQVDTRQGVGSGFANISGWLNLLQYNIGQMNAAGGNVNIVADGAIVQHAGSLINVNGGYVTYQPGFVNTSYLTLPNGTLVNVANATGDTLYTGVVNLPNGPSNFVPGYVQGSSAGTVNISAPIVVLQGGMNGQTTVGSLQRDVSAVDSLSGNISRIVFGYPKGGELQIGGIDSAIEVTSNLPNPSDMTGFEGNLIIGNSSTQTAAPPSVGAPFDPANPDQSLMAGNLALDPSILALAGFNRIVVQTISGNINVAVPVSLSAGGLLSLTAGVGYQPGTKQGTVSGGDIQLDAPITIPDGTVTASAKSSGVIGTLTVADGVSFNLEGLWTNDQASSSPALDANGYPDAPVVLNGGALKLVANQINVGNNVSANVSAGAWLDSQAKLHAGAAGSLTLEADPTYINNAVVAGILEYGTGLDLSGYGFSSGGGSLKLVGSNVFIGTPSATSGAAPTDLWLQPGFFQSGGFTSYNINANYDLSIQSNTTITPQASSWQLATGYNLIPSGNMLSVAAPYLFALNDPATQRPSTSVAFNALGGVNNGNPQNGMLTVNDGAQLILDPGANLTLSALEQLTVLGTLNAPGGNIGLYLTASGLPFNAQRSIWFGSQAKILAMGSLQRIYTNADGVSGGAAENGGTIQIGDLVGGVLYPAEGYVVAMPGSVFNVSGTEAAGLSFKSDGVVTPAQFLSTAGGSISIDAYEGLLFAGTLVGSGGGGSPGGSLSVELGSNVSSPGDPGNPVGEWILNIQPSLTATGTIVPKGLTPQTEQTLALLNSSPSQPSSADILVDVTKGTGKNVVDLGYFLTGTKPGTGAKYANEGWISTTSFSGGGFGQINFKSPNILAFDLGKSNITLSAYDSLILDAPNITAIDNATNNAILALTGTGKTVPKGYALNLSSPYIELGAADFNYQLPDAVYTGLSSLNAYGSTIDLIGNSALNRFGTVNLNAVGDIRLVGLDTGAGEFQGSLAMIGNLTLNDAQTYPTTMSNYTFMVAADPANSSSGKLTFSSNGNAPQQVLSAAGTLTAIAPDIIQDGVVVAPFGSIVMGNLDSTWSPSILYGTYWSSVYDGVNTIAAPTDSRIQTILTANLAYAPGSVTSVAGSGIVPFGYVSNGSVPSASTWFYGEYSIGSSSAGSNLQLPGKSIVSNAKSITAGSGAQLNLSGGGSLLSYEFTPGSGGSQDVLNNATTWAISPNFKGGVAPADSNYGGTGLTAGASVYLSGLNGLPAGVYTLLPAHYALLPGFYSITVAPNTNFMPPAKNTVLPDNSMLVSGYFTLSGSGRSSSISEGFMVYSGSVISHKSQFTLFDASTYFADQASANGVAVPALPIDGGYLAFNTSGSMSLDGMIELPAASGQVMASSFNDATWAGTIGLVPASGGKAGMLDISAPQISVVPGAGGGSGTTTLSDAYLNAIGADSLVLGGLRNTGGGTEQIAIGASQVTLGANTALSGPDIVVVANNSIVMEAGASLQGVGTSDHLAQDLSLASGALLRVSSGNAVSVTRTTSSDSGTLNIASGATVVAAGSANLEATGGIALNGNLKMAAGSALDIGAPGMALGSGIPSGLPATTLQLGTSELNNFGSLASLTLNSYASPINLYGTVNLGSPSSALRSLTFQGGGFQGDGGTVNFYADTVNLVGTASSASPVSPASSSGTLAIQANTLQIGGNAFSIHGYDNADLTAQGQLTVTGTSGLVVADQNMNLAAGVIDTRSAASGGFVAGGTLTLASVANPLPVTSVGLGGQLSFSGASISSTADVYVPSGTVTMTATGGVDVNGGQLSAAGASVAFNSSTTSYAPAGSVTLSGSEVTIGNGAVVDVSARNAAAGSLSITAGTFNLAGALLGNATGTTSSGALPEQGQFSLVTNQAGSQTGSLAGSSDWLGTLAAQIGSSGFTGSQYYRFSNGDVTLGASDILIAHQVVIATDNGSINIAGEINASGPTGGSIGLYASQPQASGSSGNVTIGPGAQLLACATTVCGASGYTLVNAAGTNGNGGQVIIGTASADGLSPGGVSGGSSINLLGGVIDVGGSNANGTVILRAPTVNNNTDVAIGRNAQTSIRNSASTVIEGYNVYWGSTIMGTDPAANNQAGVNMSNNLDPSVSGAMYANAASFMNNQSTILSHLGIGSLSNVSINPGIEVRSTGNLTVSVNEFAATPSDRGWNLDAWRFGPGNSPVILSLRAAGNLDILGSISDGFVNTPGLAMPDWSLGTGASASYRLVGGANLVAADPLAVVPGGGNVYFGFAERTPSTSSVPFNSTTGAVAWQSTDGSITSSNAPSAAANAPITPTDAPVALVRTGTGSIDIASGGDVTLAMAPFFVYKSGDPTINGTPVIYDSVNAGTGVYQVTLYGASVYTAGQAANLTGSGFTAPVNQLNVQYGAAKGDMTAAAFGYGGGAITVNAQGNVYGPQNLAGTWYYLNADGQPAQPADPTTSPPTPATPAVPGTEVSLPAVVPQMVDNWLFRQGRTYVDTNGNVQFEQVGQPLLDSRGRPVTSMYDPAVAQAQAQGYSVGVVINSVNGKPVIYEFAPIKTAWWTRYDYFNSGIATFGGGNLAITAGGNVSNLYAGAATDAYAPGNSPASLTEQGGGNLSVQAGGNILGGGFYVQNGTGSLYADGAISAGNYLPTGSSSATPLNPILALGNAVFNVAAGGSVAVETAYNPMLTEQSAVNVPATSSQLFGAVMNTGGGLHWNLSDMSSNSVDYRYTYQQFSNFSTYGGNSAVNLMAIGGDLLLGDNAVSVAAAGGSGSTLAGIGGGNVIPNVLSASNAGFTSLYVLEPAGFSAVSLGGSLASQNSFIMMPSATGQLNLLAADSIFLTDGRGNGINMLDNNPSSMSVTDAPRVFTPSDFSILTGLVTQNTPPVAFHTLGGLHSGDGQPVEIVALTGDIVGDNSNVYTISLPKFAEIQAGGNIVDLGFSIQQNNAADVTTISAGHDFVDSTLSGGSHSNLVANIVDGPGNVDIRAGGTVDFGNGNGIVTRGNLDDPYLPVGGAGISIMAGARPDYVSAASWMAQYGSVTDVPGSSVTLSGAAAGLTASDQKDLIAFVRALDPNLSASGTTAVTALANFYLLTPAQQAPFLAAHFAAAGILAPVADMLALDAFMSEQEALAMAGYVRSIQPGLPAFQTLADTYGAFLNLTAAQQNSFNATHPGILPFLQLSASSDNVWAAFRALPQAEQNTFLVAHPDVAANLAANAAQLYTALGVMPNFSSLTVQDWMDLGNAVNNPMPSNALPLASWESKVWSAFQLLPQAAQVGYLSSHADVEAQLAAGMAALSPAQIAALSQKPANAPELDTSYFSALVEASGQTNNGLSNFDSLVASLFPAAAAATSAGNIDVFSSQIKTEQGGDISLFTPAGSVYAGLTTGTAGKAPADQGIFTISGGAISSLVKHDFLVNLGRVFTLGGGDITLVSQYNDINAGKGAKTAVSAQPPQITMDSNGNISVDVSGSISGSGIATLKTNPYVPAGNVYLVAPRGTVDAGDAGVRSSGNILVNAVTVLNGNNFAAAGVSAGVPVAAAPPPPPPAPAPPGTSQSTDSATKNLDNANAAANATLNVEVVGYGTNLSGIDKSELSLPEEDSSDSDKKKRNRKKI